MSRSNSPEAVAVAFCLVALTAAGIGLSVSGKPRPQSTVDAPGPTDWTFHDPAVPLADRLRKLPGIARVDVPVAVQRPQHRIVHLLNVHYVGPDDYAADLRDLSDEPISDAEIDRWYSEFLADVVRLQNEQRELLTRLIDDHGLEAVHMEGWTVEDAELFRLIAETLWRAELAADVDLLNLDDPLADRRLAFGVPARLWATGKLQAILPAEDSELLEAANPIGDDGQFRDVDESTTEAREDFMVREMLKRGGVSLIVLGNAHDLADNVRRLPPGRCEYLRIATGAYAALVESED